MRLLNLPGWLRGAGLTVVEVPGWEARGDELPGTPSVVIGHHTATSRSVKGDLPTLRILRDGRTDLRGPLCQVALGRSGTAYVIAAGKANHAGRGAWGVTDSARTIGIEVEHPGTGGWDARQLAAFDRCAAALLRGLGQPASHYCGHREWALPAGRKVDPGGIDLPAQRNRIALLLKPKQSEELDMTADELRNIVREEVNRLSGGPRTRDAQGNVVDNDPQTISIADVYTLLEQVRADVRGKQ